MTIRLPGNSSRTSTHAISVPKIALTTTTIAETASVSLIAASAWGLVTSFQNADAPPLPAFASTAATGRSTRTDR